jgi:O-antigen/teichoic acid export membrane protein
MASGVQRFARDVSFSFASLGITALVHFILRVFLARYLGAGDLGLYTLSFTVYSFGMLFSVFGIGAALTKYVAQYKEDPPKTKFLVSSGSITAFLIGCAVGLILYFCSAPIANIFFDMPELGGLLRIVSFVFPFIALEKATLGFLNGLRRMRLFALISITQSVLTIILTIALVSWGYGPRGAVLSFVLPIILMSLFSLFSIRKSLAKPKLEYCTPAIKILLVFGGYVVLANSMGLIQTYTDSIMLGYFMTEIDVGIYAVAILLAQAIRLPSQAIQMITSPTIATHWGKNEVDNIENLINKAMKYTAIFIIPVGFLAAFLAHEIITLIFGAEFVPAVFPLQILVIGTVIVAIQSSVGGALSSTAYVSMVFKLSGVTMVANIILNLLLIPRLGITGAAIATSTAMIIDVLLHLYFIQRLIGVRIHWKWFASLLTFTALLAAATYGSGLIVSHYIGITIAFIILIVILLKYFVTREDIAQIRKIIPSGNSRDK